jgi:hypothetical protein
MTRTMAIVCQADDFDTNSHKLSYREQEVIVVCGYSKGKKHE